MDNPEQLATLGAQDEKERDKTKTQRPMCWKPLYENEHI